MGNISYQSCAFTVVFFFFFFLHTYIHLSMGVCRYIYENFNSLNVYNLLYFVGTKLNLLKKSYRKSQEL